MWFSTKNITILYPTKMLLENTILRLSAAYSKRTLTSVSAMNDALDEYFCRGCELIYKELVDGVAQDRKLSKDERRSMVEDILSFLRPCNCAFEVIFPVKQDDGRHELFTGYRIQHKLHFKPCFGGVSVAPDVDREWLGARAALTSYACASAGVPFGGAHAGLRLDPSNYSRHELERVLRRFALELFSRGIAGPSVDVLGPEPDSQLVQMSWIADTYCKTVGNSDMLAGACVTGKPGAQGGLPDHAQAQARGLFLAVHKMLSDHQDFWARHEALNTLNGQAVLLQGLGDAGAQLLPMLAEVGAKCVGVESEGLAVYNPLGVDAQALQEHCLRHGSLAEFPGVWRSEPSEGLCCEACDVLLLLDPERTLDSDQASRVQAKVVVEAVAFGLSATAAQALAERGVLVLPDVYALGARAAVARLEWLKGAGRTAFGSTFMHFGRKCSAKLLGSVQEALERRLGRAGGRIVLAPPEHLWPARSEADIVQASLEQSTESVANGIVETLQRYNLGTDVRAAAYANAIRDLFEVYSAAGLDY